LLVPVAVRGVSWLRDWVAAHDATRSAARAVGWLVLLGLVVAATATFPMRAIHIAELSAEIRSPWETIEASDIGPAIVAVPAMDERRAPGWAFGHPYTLTTKRGDRVDLISPASERELLDAIAYLGTKPVFVLVLDKETYMRTGHRRFTLEPVPIPSPAH
jgi:hypothetical protein